MFYFQLATGFMQTIYCHSDSTGSKRFRVYPVDGNMHMKVIRIRMYCSHKLMPGQPQTIQRMTNAVLNLLRTGTFMLRPAQNVMKNRISIATRTAFTINDRLHFIHCRFH